jgi:molybdate transport system substrate-binding protein
MALGLLALPLSVAHAETVTVFAAASMKNALDAADAAWEKATGNTVRVSYAASSVLAKQIENGAPADVFISADQDWMNYLEKKEQVKADTRSDLVRNSIVLIAPANSATGDVTIEKDFPLAQLLGDDGKLAMGEVNSVPAGKYGKAALEKLGVWDKVSDKVAQADNVRAALLLVSRGEAKLGIVYRTDAAVDKGVKVIGTFPADTHKPIVYPIALMAGSKSTAAADYLAFLKSDEAKAFYTEQGFTPAE